MIFEKILKESSSSIDEEKIVKYTGMTISEIENAFNCKIINDLVVNENAVFNSNFRYYIPIDLNGIGLNFLTAEEIENHKASGKKRLPRIGHLFAGLIDLDGPFTRKEIAAAYGKYIGQMDKFTIRYPYFERAGLKGREILWNLINLDSLNKRIEKWKATCVDFWTAKEAAEERVLAVRRKNDK